jgi:hypothetical protein
MADDVVVLDDAVVEMEGCRCLQPYQVLPSVTVDKERMLTGGEWRDGEVAGAGCPASTPEV